MRSPRSVDDGQKTITLRSAERFLASGRVLLQNGISLQSGLAMQLMIARKRGGVQGNEGGCKESGIVMLRSWFVVRGLTILI
jgi:hypothetical protein